MSDPAMLGYSCSKGRHEHCLLRDCACACHRPGPELSRIREHLGWLVGRTIVEVTSNDPFDVPGADGSELGWVWLHLDNGGVVTFKCGEAGLDYENPDDEEDEDHGRHQEGDSGD